MEAKALANSSEVIVEDPNDTYRKEIDATGKLIDTDRVPLTKKAGEQDGKSVDSGDFISGDEGAAVRAFSPPQMK